MSDPKKPEDEALLGAPTAPTEPSPSAALRPADPTTSPAESTAPLETGNPLFGASPPPAESGDTGVKERVEQGSRERVESLRRARTAALGTTSPSVSQPPPPPIARLSRPPKPSSSRPSTLIPFLRRLTFVLSLLLGAGASIALVWSAFLLPRLHSSFSARRALVDQQVGRAGSLLTRLRAVRAMGVHAGYKRDGIPEAGEKIGEVEGQVGEKGRDKGKAKATEDDAKPLLQIRELSSSAHSSASSQADAEAPSPEAAPLIPDLVPLLASLKALSSTRGNTSTTRTSLLSTIESYTSALHRQLWNPRPGAGRQPWGTGYGMNTLDQSLRNASGGASIPGGSVYKDGWEGEGLVDRSEEWDKVRKEVRGIKGMLLGRRSMGIGA